LPFPGFRVNQSGFNRDCNPVNRGNDENDRRIFLSSCLVVTIRFNDYQQLDALLLSPKISPIELKGEAGLFLFAFHTASYGASASCYGSGQNLMPLLI
jgi:hypothetical protein